MSKLNAEELQNKWSLLPDVLQQEVLDFVEFLLSKHQLSRPSAHANYCENDKDNTAANSETSKPRKLGLNRGAVWMSDDFNEPLPDDFWLGKP